MDEYRALIDRLLAAFEEAAKLTNNRWDDLAASACRAVFERLLLRPQVSGAENEVAYHEVGQVVGATSGLPFWLVPLMAELATQLLRLLRDARCKEE